MTSVPSARRDVPAPTASDRQHALLRLARRGAPSVAVAAAPQRRHGLSATTPVDVAAPAPIWSIGVRVLLR